MMRACYILMMRTTVDIDDEILRQTKIEAAEAGETLSVVVTDALRERFVRRRGKGDEPWEPVEFSGEGGVLPGVDLSNNASLLALMDER